MDEQEACQLLGAASFGLLLIGDHPPELDAAAILQDLSFRGTCPPALILRNIVREGEKEYFRRIGAMEVLPKRDLRAIIELVAKLLAPIQFKLTATKSERVRGISACMSASGNYCCAFVSGVAVRRQAQGQDVRIVARVQAKEP